MVNFSASNQFVMVTYHQTCKSESLGKMVGWRVSNGREHFQCDHQLVGVNMNEGIKPTNLLAASGSSKLFFRSTASKTASKLAR